jgi:hypothetical protein
MRADSVRSMRGELFFITPAAECSPADNDWPSGLGIVYHGKLNAVVNGRDSTLLTLYAFIQLVSTKTRHHRTADVQIPQLFGCLEQNRHYKTSESRT